MAKTVRFSQLVKSSGRPHVVTLWGDPGKDRAFGRAIRENRILTVKQNPVGSRRDVGRIGFLEEKNVSYLVFPKPLSEAKDTQVVGIKYDLLTEGEPAGGFVPTKQVRKMARKPGEKNFSVTIRRTAAIETVVLIKAPNRKKAEALALAQIHQQPFDAREAVIHNEVRGVDSQ